MDIRKKTKLNSFLVVLIVLLVLCSCLIFSTLAWLEETYVETDDNSNIGLIDVVLYANGSPVVAQVGLNGETYFDAYEVSSGSTSRSLNLKMRNEGNIDAIVRVKVCVYYMENDNKRVPLIVASSPSDGTIVLGTSSTWVRQFPVENVASGYMFYNAKLESYTTRYTDEDDITTSTNALGEASIIDTIVVSESQKDTKLYVDVSVDAVAYSGNIYKKIENNEKTLEDIPVYAYPFGTKEDLPSSWTAWK